jgi:cytochrome P450
MKAPGPRTLRPGGSFPDFRRDPLAFLTGSARQHGDVVAFRFFHVPVWLVNGPEFIEQVLSTKAASFMKGRGLQAGRPIFGDGLLTSEGEFWKRQRRLAQPAFHRDRIASYGGSMGPAADRMLETFHEGETRDAHADFMRLTLEIAGRTLFGLDVSHEAHEVGEALEIALSEFPSLLNPLVRIFLSRLPTRRAKRLKGSVSRLDAVIFRMIGERRALGADTGDLLSMLLAARDEDGSGMTDRQLRDEVLTIFLAGHETTAIALTWAVLLLSRHPAERERLEAEADALAADRAVAFDDLRSLPFTEAVVKESLRLFPPAWAIGRTALEDVEIGGHVIRKGSAVLVSPWVAHRDGRFFDEPEAFRPARWLDEKIKVLPRFAWFPFGGGPRVCIGSAFAMMEAVLVLAAVARRVRLDVVPGHPVEPFPSVTLRPRHGLRVTVSKRSSRPSSRS